MFRDEEVDVLIADAVAVHHQKDHQTTRNLSTKVVKQHRIFWKMAVSKAWIGIIHAALLCNVYVFGFLPTPASNQRNFCGLESNRRNAILLATQRRERTGTSGYQNLFSSSISSRVRPRFSQSKVLLQSKNNDNGDAATGEDNELGTQVATTIRGGAENEEEEDTTNDFEVAKKQLAAFREMAFPYFQESTRAKWLFAGMVSNIIYLKKKKSLDLECKFKMLNCFFPNITYIYYCLTKLLNCYYFSL